MEESRIRGSGVMAALMLIQMLAVILVGAWILSSDELQYKSGRLQIFNRNNWNTIIAVSGPYQEEYYIEIKAWQKTAVTFTKVGEHKAEDVFNGESLTFYVDERQARGAETMSSVLANTKDKWDGAIAEYSESIQYLDWQEQAKRICEQFDGYKYNINDDVNGVTLVRGLLCNKVVSPREFFDSEGGICTGFASTMTAILRRNGVPARLVFGNYNGDNRHMWVEVRKQDGSGDWVGYDPTSGKSDIYNKVKGYEPRLYM